MPVTNRRPHDSRQPPILTCPAHQLAGGPGQRVPRRGKSHDRLKPATESTPLLLKSFRNRLWFTPSRELPTDRGKPLREPVHLCGLVGDDASLLGQLGLGEIGQGQGQTTQRIA
ncbi:hypothetical protein [Streptomyces smyrnaeus]|uniref:hypothetical protein n=1 Tax=Streptomyces smyrnaeus TaxID=1387713 RepID=UPI0036EA9366